MFLLSACREAYCTGRARKNSRLCGIRYSGRQESGTELRRQKSVESLHNKLKIPRFFSLTAMQLGHHSLSSNTSLQNIRTVFVRRKATINFKVRKTRHSYTQLNYQRLFIDIQVLKRVTSHFLGKY